jgi:hypothetical protein
MPKVHMKSSAGDSKTYDSIEEYEADQDGDWYPVEEPKGTKLTMELLEKAGKEGVKMANDCFDEGHTLTLVKEGGPRRRKTRRGKKVRSSRKSRR